MSILRVKGGHQSPLDALVSGLNAAMTKGRQQYSDNRLTAALTMQTESLGSDGIEFVVNQSKALTTLIVESFDELKEQGISLNMQPDAAGEAAAAASAVDGESQGGLNAAQLEAATIVAMAANNPSEYAHAATSTTIPSELGNVVAPVTEGLGGELLHRGLVMKQEAFSEAPLRDMLSWSILFNAAAARQDAFGEAFFKTVVITPNEAGLALTIARSMVVNAPFHDTKGTPNDLQRRNLIDAARYPEVLEDESTRLYPVVAQDGSNSQYFVPSALVAPVMKTIDKMEFRTAPLKPGKVGLIGISTPDFLRQTGVIDLTDAIGNGARLNDVYVQVGDDVLKWNVRGLATSGFVKSQEGSERRVNLFFETKELVLTGSTKTASGGDTGFSQLLADNGLTARMSLQVSGSIDTQTGELSIMGQVIGIDSLLDANEDDVPMNAGVGQSVADAFADAVFLGYDLFAVRTNENRRQRGLLLDQLEERYVYAIPLNAPISVPSPVGSARPAQHLEAMIAAQRMRCSNDAVTSLINHAGQLSEYMAGVRKQSSVPQIGAVGRLLVKPFYEKRRIDALQVVANLQDKDKAADIASLLLNVIKDMGVRMMIESAYPAALAATLTGSKVPKLIVGTDNLIAQHLIVQGDLRTFGAIFKDPLIVATLNKKMDGRIFVALTRDNASNVPDPLQYGWMGWIPELVSVVQVSRYGTTYQEAMTQARYLHINNLPVLGEIEVLNLSAALTQKLSVKVDATTTPADGPGTGFPGTGGDTAGDGGDAGAGDGTGAGTGQP